MERESRRSCIVNEGSCLLEKHDFWYPTLLSNGDAKTYKHLCSLNVYGDVSLTKEECVNHVAKQMEMALRNLSTKDKKNGVTHGGRGYSKLTQAAITTFTGYFGKAIRAHPNDLEAMKNAVSATFHHAISTDEKPDHDLCPKGKKVGASTRKHLLLGKCQALIGPTLGRLSLKKWVPLSRTCMCALAIQTFWGDASWVKPRTRTSLCIRLTGGNARRRVSSHCHVLYSQQLYKNSILA